MGSDGAPPPESTTARLLRPAFRLIVALPLIWGGVRIIALGNVLVGLVLLAAGGITAALAARRLISAIRRPESGIEASGELSKDEFDYIVWMAIGLPLVMVVGLVALILAGPR